MKYMKAGWATIQTSQSQVEILPSHDVIEHTSSFVCICHPQIESEVVNGTVYWTITHNSFDESLDEDDLEPYNGI